MKILKINAKCSDMFYASIRDNRDNTRPLEYNYYVPSWFPNPRAQHGGDYVKLEIDIETGQILNWKTPTPKQLAIFK